MSAGGLAVNGEVGRKLHGQQREELAAEHSSATSPASLQPQDATNLLEAHLHCPIQRPALPDSAACTTE
jgi:hypothetical protein